MKAPNCLYCGHELGVMDWFKDKTLFVVKCEWKNCGISDLGNYQNKESALRAAKRITKRAIGRGHTK